MRENHHWIKVQIINGIGMIHVFNGIGNLIHIYCILNWQILSKVHLQVSNERYGPCISCVIKKMGRDRRMIGERRNV